MKQIIEFEQRALDVTLTYARASAKIIHFLNSQFWNSSEVEFIGGWSEPV